MKIRCKLLETFHGGTHDLFMARPMMVEVDESPNPHLYFKGELFMDFFSNYYL